MAVMNGTLEPAPIDSPPLTVPEAIAAVLVAAVAVDGVVQPEEAVRIGSVLASSNVLRRPGNGATHDLAEHAIALIADYGLPAVLTGCAKVIPTDLRPTTFALATDLLLADGRIGDREKTFIDELQVVLRIDDGTARRIMDVLVIKNRGA
jgi:hypothetical protein